MAKDMTKEYEQSKYDIEKPGEPEGSPKDIKSDVKGLKALMHARGMKGSAMVHGRKVSSGR